MTTIALSLVLAAALEAPFPLAPGTWWEYRESYTESSLRGVDSTSDDVTRFEVLKSFMDRYQIQQVGASHHTEWWIPAEELAALNDSIVGSIEVIGEYREP